MFKLVTHTRLTCFFYETVLVIWCLLHNIVIPLELKGSKIVGYNISHIETKQLVL